MRMKTFIEGKDLESLKEILRNFEGEQLKEKFSNKFDEMKLFEEYEERGGTKEKAKLMNYIKKNLRKDPRSAAIAGIGKSSKLKEWFRYRGKKLKFNDLKTEMRGAVETTSKGFQNENEVIEELNLLIRMKGEPMFNIIGENAERILKTFQSSLSRKDTTEMKGTGTIWGFGEEIGKLSFSRWSSRERFYDYWEKIYPKHEDWMKANDEVWELAKIEFKEDEKLFDMFTDLKEYSDISHDYIHNYVVSGENLQVTLPPLFRRAVKLVEVLIDEGNTLYRKKPKLTSVGKGQAVARVGYGQAGIGPREKKEQLGPDINYDELKTYSIEEGDIDSIKEFSAGEEVILDPLLAYEFAIEGLPLVAIAPNEISELKEYVMGEHGLVAQLSTLIRNKEVLVDIMDFFEEMEKELNQAQLKEEYHFPYVSPLSELITESATKPRGIEIEYSGYTKKDIPPIQNADNIEDYLDLLNKIIVKVSSRYRVPARRPKIPTAGEEEEGGSEKFRTQQQRIFGMEEVSGREEEPKLREFDEDFKKVMGELLDIVTEYFITPFETNYAFDLEMEPFSAKKVSTLNISRAAKSYSPEHEGPTAMQIDFSIDHTEPEDWNALTKFLELLKAKQKIEFGEGLMTKANDALDALDNITDSDIDGDTMKKIQNHNKNTIGNVLYIMGKRVGLTEEELIQQRYGNLREMRENHLENQEASPLYTLPSKVAFHIKATRRGDVIFGGGRKGKFSPSEIDEETKNGAKEFLETWNSLGNSLSVINVQLQKAHDLIRKIQGKPVYWEACNIDDFEDVSHVMDTISKSHRTDLTATEIRKIVTSTNSYESIAKRIGSNKEVIYHVKAICR